MFAKVNDDVFGHTFSVCMQYLMTFCVVHIIAGCSCHNVSQLEVRNKSTRLGVDPSKLEKAVGIGC
jgi:hypothetical protein